MLYCQVLFERRKDIPAMSFTVGSVLDANCGLPIVLDSKSLADADAMLSQCRSNMVSIVEKGISFIVESTSKMFVIVGSGTVNQTQRRMIRPY